MLNTILLVLNLYKEPLKKVELPEPAPQSVATYRWQA